MPIGTQESLSPCALVGTETGEVTDCPQERPSRCQRTKASSHQGEREVQINICIYSSTVSALLQVEICKLHNNIGFVFIMWNLHSNIYMYSCRIL